MDERVGGGRCRRGEGREGKIELSKAGGGGRREKGLEGKVKLVTKSGLFLLNFLS